MVRIKPQNQLTIVHAWSLHEDDLRVQKIFGLNFGLRRAAGPLRVNQSESVPESGRLWMGNVYGNWTCMQGKIFSKAVCQLLSQLENL